MRFVSVTWKPTADKPLPPPEVTNGRNALYIKNITVVMENNASTTYKTVLQNREGYMFNCETDFDVLIRLLWDEKCPITPESQKVCINEQKEKKGCINK